jgi:Recombination enhancement, RecA-dependent nuclease
MSNPTKKELKMWDDIASIGCLPCAQDGFLNTMVSIHHCDGRTKPQAHKMVIALCAGHHQDGTNSNAPKMLAIHPYKRQFEAKYGSQSALIQQTKEELIKRGMQHGE